MAEYKPSREEIKKAWSVLASSDADSLKLFKDGKATFIKIFGGDINEFKSINSNLIISALFLEMLEKLDSIENKLSSRSDPSKQSEPDRNEPEQEPEQVPEQEPEQEPEEEFLEVKAIEETEEKEKKGGCLKWFLIIFVFFVIVAIIEC